MEKKQDLRELVFSGEREDLLYLAGICQGDGKFYVAEEKYSWIGIKSSSEKGVRKKLRKMAADARREFRKHIICNEKTAKFA